MIFGNWLDGDRDRARARAKDRGHILTSPLTTVPLLCNLEMESDNWRFRQLLALQLGELFILYDEQVIQAELYPIFMKLCRDPVAEVPHARNTHMGMLANARTNSNASLFLPCVCIRAAPRRLI